MNFCNIRKDLYTIMGRGFISFVLCFISFSVFSSESYYGLFPKPVANAAFSQMKAFDKETRKVEWSCGGCVPLTQIVLKRSDYRLSPKDQGVTSLSSIVEIPCVTPAGVFTLFEYTTLKDLGFYFEKDLKGKFATLTFKRNGRPDTLFIGVAPTVYEEVLNAPTIRLRSGDDVFFCRGMLHSFVASMPDGFTSNDVLYNWYIDGEKMTGRHDRWFDTYSRANWADGEHRVECEMVVDGKVSPRAVYNLVQLPGANCELSVKAFPYWGAECVDDTSGAELKYNPEKEWGSFLITPMEEYVHFYLEVINRKITSSTITNSDGITDFVLIEKSEADVDFQFFKIPLNMKARASEPYFTRRVYFRFEGENINYSMLPYISPEVKLSEDTLEVCENSFVDGDRPSVLAVQKGFDTGKYRVLWYYSTEINGKYDLIPNADGVKYEPLKVGYYKAEVTDGVFSAMSSPLTVVAKTDNCISVAVVSEGGRGHVCEGEKLYLHSSISSSNFTYQWKVGSIDGSNLRDIPGANKADFRAEANKRNEAYFVEVADASQHILSNPFVVREIAKLPSLKELTITAMPMSVCEGQTVNLFANFQTRDKDAVGKRDYIYNFYKKGAVGDELIFSDTTHKRNNRFNRFVSENSVFYAEMVGCDGSLRSSSDVAIDVIKGDKCRSGKIFVKQTGNDYNDGLSWTTAFQSLSHALEVAFDMRQSGLYDADTIRIYVAAGTYSSMSNGFDVPDNTVIYGGYDEEPVDGTMSAIVRNPQSPANLEGNLTKLVSESAFSRIVRLVDRKNVKFVGVCFDGDAISKESWLTGRAVYADGASVELDSCWIRNFYFSVNQSLPITAVSALKKKSVNKDTDLTLKIRNTTFSANKGGDIGSCLGVFADYDVTVENCVFNNNTTMYSGGVALLLYDASPKVKVLNSTFYDNTCQNGIGYFGRTVIRMVGGFPQLDIYSSTVCGRFYKENGKLRIYNSIVECAGRADVYSNNFPKLSPFVDDASRDINGDSRPFLANFRGGIAGKLQSKGGLTQVLVPSNMLEIISQAGEPHNLTPRDQRGFERNRMASTFGAYDLDHSSHIKLVYEACPDFKKTEASFVASVVGLKNPKHQWVNNYSNVEGATTKDIEKLGIGTYWLETTGEDANGYVVTISSNEIRVSDICESPGVFFVKSVKNGGDDSYAGTTWNQAYATIDRALSAAAEYKKKEGVSMPVKIYVAEGVYTPHNDKGFDFLAFGKISNVTIFGGYPANATTDAERTVMKFGETAGNKTVFKAKSDKGQIFYSNDKVEGVRFVGIYFEGLDSVDVTVPAFSFEGGSVSMDSCVFTNFVDASQTSSVCPLFSVSKTTNLSLKNCVVANNKSGGVACLSVTGKSNKSIIKISNTTFANNQSKLFGGSVLHNLNASPDMRIYNSTFFGNECVSGDVSAASLFYLESGEPNIKVYYSTLIGSCFRESGSLRLYHSIVESVGGYCVNANSYVAYPHLEKISDKMPVDEQASFRSLFDSGLTSCFGFTPVLRPVKTDSPVFNRISAIVSMDGVDLTKDQCGRSRNALSVLGSYEVEMPVVE